MIRVGKRITTGLLALLFSLLCSIASAAAIFSFPDEKTATRKALELFRLCAFYPEYGSGEETPLSRWEEEIRIWAGGVPTREDLLALDIFLAELPEKVPDMPPVRRVRQDTNANIRLWFVPEYMLRYYLEDYVEGNKGFFQYIRTSNRITSARIGIASDTTEQEDRNHLILEELVGTLGLPGDHTLYTDSILYEGWTLTQSLSEVDWRMLNLLYSPAVFPGMSWAQAQRAIHQALGL